MSPAPNRRPAQRVVRCKAHRKGQGEGVFTYVEPHLRSNAPRRAEPSPGGRSKQSEAYRRKQGEGVWGHRGRAAPYRAAACFSALSAFSSSAHGVCGLRRRRRKSSKNQQPRRAEAVFPPVPSSGGRREFIFFSFPAPPGRENRHRSALPRCRRRAAPEERAPQRAAICAGPYSEHGAYR